MLFLTSSSVFRRPAFISSTHARLAPLWERVSYSGNTWKSPSSLLAECSEEGGGGYEEFRGGGARRVQLFPAWLSSWDWFIGRVVVLAVAEPTWTTLQNIHQLMLEASNRLQHPAGH